MAKPVVETTGTKPHFMGLPVEIRLCIYEHVFAHRNKKQWRLVRVSRQIHDEALPLLCSQEYYFLSPDELATWATQRTPRILGFITNITMHIFDGWFQLNVNPDTQETTEKNLDGLDKFRQTLLLLPALRKLWLVTRSDIKYRRADRDLLAIIASTCPHLEELSFFTSPSNLSFLAAFKNLKHLTFGGSSDSSPTRTIDTLTSLPNLHSLSLLRYPTYYDKDHGYRSGEFLSKVCVTPEVVSSLAPLRTLVIRHMTSGERSAYLTPAMLDAVIQRHKASLRSLQIFSNDPMEVPLFEKFLKFIKESKLEELYFHVNIPAKADPISLEPYFPNTLRYASCLVSAGGQSSKGIRSQRGCGEVVTSY